jgi:hypothetical protein
MRYAQIKGGQKLHLVCEPGEEYYGEIIRAGTVSAPLCKARHFNGSYRMTINVPLANACKNCLRVWRTRP